MKKSQKLRLLSLVIVALIILGFLPFAACEQAGSDSAAIVSSVLINEVMSSNSAFAPAADGRYYDWCELYNDSDEPIDLSSCYFSDSSENLIKFSLSGLVLPPKSYTIVYFSDLDTIDANGSYHANFKLSSKGEILILYNTDGTIIDSIEIPTLSENVSYGRSPNDASELVYFIAPTPGSENSSQYADSISKITQLSCPVIVNEYMSKNSYTVYDSDSDYGDWVELYNPSDDAYDLSGCSLSDDADSPGKWVFPQGAVIGAGEYMLVWCDSKDKLDDAGEYHTNFSLGDEDRIIALYTVQRLCASYIDMVADLPKNVSCGYPQGESELRLFSRATPRKPNSSSGYSLDTIVSPDINDGLLISEVLSVSSSSGSYTSDYIELFNSTSSAISLGGYTIQQTPGEVVFTFPEMSIGAGSYLLIYCDGTLKTSKNDLHCPIKLSSGGESLYLAEPDGRICDYFETGKTENGHSSGRVGSDCSTRVVFYTPTPGKANSSSYAQGYSPIPEFSLSGGYVDSGTVVEISAPEDCTIYYTTDGSEPTKSSKKYSGPITVTKTTVIKAATYRSGYLLGQTACETFLVEDKHDIAVVSLSGSYNDILGDDYGFYTNYKNGREVRVHIEFFDESGSKEVEFEAGAAIFGAYSRSLDQKGIKLKLKEKYGQNEVTYPFFPESVSNVTSFKTLLLRPSGQDYNRAKLRDELVPAIIRGQMDIDYQEMRACALYINGEYWGLYYIREKLDAEYLEHKYGYEEGSFDLIKGQYMVQAGTDDAYAALEKYAREHDLTVAANYEYMCSQIDIDSLINFWIVETFFCNTDTGNIRCYKAEDGKWRWMLYDFDWAMTQSTWKANFIKSYCLGSAHGTNKHMSNVIIRKMLANKEFRDRFISLYCYHLNTTFKTERTLEILDEMAAVIESEIPRQAERWGAPTVNTWNKQLTFLEKFFTEKPAMAEEQLMEAFGLSRAELDRYLKENTEYPEPVS